jgi:hypothetical protein
LVSVDKQHGVDGWELVEMDWNPDDGVSYFLYERTITGVGVETRVVYREQPTTFRHDGWWDRDRTERVYKLTELDKFKIERGYYNEEVEFDNDIW